MGKMDHQNIETEGHLHSDHEMKMEPSAGNKIRDFIPLIVIFAIILTLSVLLTSFSLEWSWTYWMRMFMGSFFGVFGMFKIIKWKDFAQSYATYDIIAKRSKLYSFSYPLIELGLGAMFFWDNLVFLASWITLVAMVISSIGVARELLKKREFTCACLGTVFKIPMTWVTFSEDVLMALMALVMIVGRF